MLAQSTARGESLLPGPLVPVVELEAELLALLASSGSRVLPGQHLKLCHRRDAGHSQSYQLCSSIRSRKTFTPLEQLMLIHQRKRCKGQENRR